MSVYANRLEIYNLYLQFHLTGSTGKLLRDVEFWHCKRTNQKEICGCHKARDICVKYFHFQEKFQCIDNKSYVVKNLPATTKRKLMRESESGIKPNKLEASHT